MAQIRRMESPGGRNLRTAVAGLGKVQSRVGWFESARYPDGTPVAMVAVVQEYGSPSRGVPPRPTMRPTQTEKQSEWAQVAGQIAKAVVQGDLKPSAVVEAVALKAEGDVRAAITKLTSPPLKEATVEARRRRNAKGRKDGKGEASDKPLNDTGLLLATLTSQTVDK